MNAIRQLILMTAMVILSVPSEFAADYVYDDLKRLTKVNYGNSQASVTLMIQWATGLRWKENHLKSQMISWRLRC